MTTKQTEMASAYEIEFHGSDINLRPEQVRKCNQVRRAYGRRYEQYRYRRLMAESG